MTIFDELKALKTGKKELRSFAYLVGSIFFLLGLLFWWKHKPYFFPPLGGGLALILIGFLLPQCLKFVYLAWMGLAFAIGAVVSRGILAVLFYLAVTPISLIARLSRKKFLDVEWRKGEGSYWIPKKELAHGLQKYETQF